MASPKLTPIINNTLRATHAGLPSKSSGRNLTGSAEITNSLAPLANIEAITAKMVLVRNAPNRPTYVGIFGTPGCGKSTAIEELAKRDSHLTVIGFGNEMMGALTANAEEAKAYGLNATDRDSLRSASVSAHDWLIDLTAKRIQEKYNDPNLIYVIDGHNIVRTSHGLTLGLSPFRIAKPPIDLSRSIILTADPNEIRSRSLIDTSRKREQSAESLLEQQELIRAAASANTYFLGAPYLEFTVPSSNDRLKYDLFVEDLHEAIYRLAFSNHTVQDIEAASSADFASPDLKILYESFPELKSFSQGVLSHKLLVMEAFQCFVAGNYLPIYSRLRHKDASFEEYSANFEALKKRFASFCPDDKLLMKLIVLFHDVGKIINLRPHHMELGGRLIEPLAKALGFDANTTALWCAVEAFHGWMGGAILAEQDPQGFLDKVEELKAIGVDPQKFIDMVIIMNTLDLAGFAGGRIIRNEYLTEFVSFLDINNIKKLKDNWYDERLRRFSKDGDEDFFGPFKDPNYQEMNRLVTSLVPDDEKKDFFDFLNTGLRIFFMSIESLNMSLKNRVKFLRVLMHFRKAINDPDFQFVTSLPNNWKALYAGKLNNFMDSIPDNFTLEDVNRSFNSNSIFGIPYSIQANRITFDFGSIL